MRVTTIDRAVFFTAGVCLGLAAGLPLGLVAAEPKTDDIRADVAEHVPADYARLVFVTTGLEPAEDDPAFDCRIHGNRICGPGNSQGVPPGQYRDVQPGITLVNFMLGQ